MPEPVKMILDDREEWPRGVAVGTFDIELGRISGYLNSGHIIFVCPNKKRCSVLIGPECRERPNPDALFVWKWDGNRECPTLTPSIDCSCGWHGVITKGEMRTC